METRPGRRTDRIEVEIPIIVSGTDCMGESFLEQSRTLVIGRHGATIALSRKLVPDQEVNVRCIRTARESDARVVGQTGGGPETFNYGVELLEHEANIWDIEFPSAEEADAALARVLLECVRCHTRELAYLNEFEYEVLEANQALSRQCRRCTDTSIWKETQLRPDEQLPVEVKPAPPGPLRRTRNDRKHVRMDLKVDVCVRHPQYGDEVAVTVNVSRGGFRFRSPKRYREGWVVEAAVPYSRTTANIFAPAQIVYAGESEAERVFVYGVKYLPATKVWPAFEPRD